MAYWYRPPHEDLSDTKAWLEEMMAIRPQDGEDFVVAFERRVIGKVGMRRFPTLGFIFHPDVWGRGFAKEALRPVIYRAFNLHRLSAIMTDVDPRNAASLRLLRSLGFVETGRAEATALIAGRWCDSVYLQLTRNEADA